MSSAVIALVCAGCGHEAGQDEPYPFRCPNAGADDVDHVLRRVFAPPPPVTFPEGEEANPFVRYRELFRWYGLARAHGWSDDDVVSLVDELDKRVEDVDGHGFTVTPFVAKDALGAHLGLAPRGLWVKDETGNVSGSHKARHLMGLLIHLELVERLGLVTGPRRDLAIASCGNAALAAAVVAAAGGRRLRVFVPTNADPAVITRLVELDARITVCPREPGVPGDPTYLELKRALADGAVPFTCQGNENGMSIEGGQTLGYELASGVRERTVRLDRLIVQVGGGALASACVAGLREAARLGAIPAVPRIHAVQTGGAFPLRRAYDLVADRLLERVGRDTGELPPGPEDEDERARFIRSRLSDEAIAEELRFAVTHRSQFMWPWEEEPASVAHGILDDETYDWLAVVEGMVSTGGYPVVVTEEELVDANEAARVVGGVATDHTGSSGLAGLLQLTRSGAVARDETVAVLFTGSIR